MSELIAIFFPRSIEYNSVINFLKKNNFDKVIHTENILPSQKYRYQRVKYIFNNNAKVTKKIDQNIEELNCIVTIFLGRSL